MSEGLSEDAAADHAAFEGRWRRLVDGVAPDGEVEWRVGDMLKTWPGSVMGVFRGTYAQAIAVVGPPLSLEWRPIPADGDEAARQGCVPPAPEWGMSGNGAAGPLLSDFGSAGWGKAHRPFYEMSRQHTRESAKTALNDVLSMCDAHRAAEAEMAARRKTDASASVTSERRGLPLTEHQRREVEQVAVGGVSKVYSTDPREAESAAWTKSIADHAAELDKLARAEAIRDGLLVGVKETPAEASTDVAGSLPSGLFRVHPSSDAAPAPKPAAPAPTLADCEALLAECGDLTGRLVSWTAVMDGRGTGSGETTPQEGRAARLWLGLASLRWRLRDVAERLEAL